MGLQDEENKALWHCNFSNTTLKQNKKILIWQFRQVYTKRTEVVFNRKILHKKKKKGGAVMVVEMN